MNFFKISPKETNLKDIVSNVPIYHVFGKIGNLAWENPVKNRTYDATIDKYCSWHDIGQELKTIYEFEQSDLQREIIETIRAADEIHFLGFGYNSFNLNLLNVKS